LNFLDRFISLFSPTLAVKRQAARVQLKMLSGGQRSYEGASKSNRLKLWTASDSSVNTEVKGGAEELRKRARELRRNNPYAFRAIQVIVSNTVGTGIKPTIKGNNKRLIKQAQMKWQEWAESSKLCDYDAQKNVYGLQSLIMESVVESGECFVIRRKLNRVEKGVPLKIQVLEPDYLAFDLNEDLKNNSKIRQGIEYNGNGERVAYHFYAKHPGDYEYNKNEKRRVRADNVLHVFKQQRPGQQRGVSFLHPVMVRLKELDIFQDASVKKQQISACFSAFITSQSGMELETTETPKSEWNLLEKLDAGTISELPPDVDIKFASPPSVDFYSDFIKQELFAIAAGLGITYEALTQDYGNVNFSSGRMGFLEFQRNIKNWQNEILITNFMIPLFDWFLDALQFATSNDINAYNLSATWTVPAREMIDPAKEINANKEAVKAGFKTISEVLRQLGYNPSDVFEERKEELEILKGLGVNTDTDPSNDQKGGVNESQETEQTDTEING
jgi:lambda family phage portal protein